MVPQSYYITLAGAVFAIGLIGALTKKNVILVLMSVDLMLNAVLLNFVSFASVANSLEAALRGQIFSIFVLVIATAEVGIGLAIVLLLFSRRQTIDVDKFSSLKG